MPPKSKAQARYLGAVAAGKNRVGGGPSPERAREMLRGAKHRDLPDRARKKRGKKDRRDRLIDQFIKRNGQA